MVTQSLSLKEHVYNLWDHGTKDVSEIARRLHCHTSVVYGHLKKRRDENPGVIDYEYVQKRQLSELDGDVIQDLNVVINNNSDIQSDLASLTDPTVKGYDYHKRLGLEIECQDLNMKEGLDTEHMLDIDIKLDVDSSGFGKIIWSSDIHNGNRWTDYASFIHYIDYLKNNNLPLGLLGDINENFNNFMGNNILPVVNQTLRIDEQLRVMIGILKDLGANNLIKFLIKGNHEMKTKKKAGTDVFDAVDFKFPIRANRAVINIHVGNQVYRGMVAHSLPGHSIYHDVHDLIRELRFGDQNIDFAVAAHTHNPGYMYLNNNGRLTPLIKVGTFNAMSDYSRTEFGGSAFISCPVTYFKADSKEIPITLPGFYHNKIMTLSIGEYISKDLTLEGKKDIMDKENKEKVLRPKDSSNAGTKKVVPTKKKKK